MNIRALETVKQKNIEICCCCAREDQELLTNLKSHLMPLQREGIITLWADGDIGAGAEWEKELHRHLNAAHIILLLISPHFMSSDYCYNVEMRRALERHESGEACVIPIILRPVEWKITPLGKLQALPTNATPITSWPNLDEAFYNTVTGLRGTMKDLGRRNQVSEVSSTYQAGGERAKVLISSDLVVREVEVPKSTEALLRQRDEDREQKGNEEYALPPTQHDDNALEAREGGLSAVLLTSESLILLPPANTRFAISPHQVTNREFQMFLDYDPYWRRGGQCQSDRKVDGDYLAHWKDKTKNIPDYPVVNVSWYAAEAYVSWLSGQRDQRLRLPTQEEWEIAARCGRTSKEWWREEIERGRVNYFETEGEIRQVNSFSPNSYGLYSILGNAYELCSASQGGIAGYGGAAHSVLSELTTPLSLEPHTCRPDVSFRFVQDLGD